MNYGAPQFQKFRVNLHKIQAVISMKLLQLSSVQDGFKKCSSLRKKQRIASALTLERYITKMTMNFSS
jgi:hypothetical protein